MTKEIQPIFILPEGTKRNTGRNAQRNNIMAAKLVAETVRTTLGPKGMDKMLVDSMGDIIVTNDGVTILDEMSVEHPAAKMLVEIAKTQENEVGDGTTTAVVLAGELLKRAEELLDMDIHPTVIVRGYVMAAEKSSEILSSIAEKVDKDDTDMLEKIACTAMTGKGVEASKEKLASIIVNAVKMVMDKRGGQIFIDDDDIKIEKNDDEVKNYVIYNCGNDLYGNVVEDVKYDSESIGKLGYKDYYANEETQNIFTSNWNKERFINPSLFNPDSDGNPQEDFPTSYNYTMADGTVVSNDKGFNDALKSISLRQGLIIATNIINNSKKPKYNLKYVERFTNTFTAGQTWQCVFPHRNIDRPLRLIDMKQSVNETSLEFEEDEANASFD